MKAIDLNNIFTYHAPFGNQAERYEKLRSQTKFLAMIVLELTPECAEQTIAIRKLQEAVMFANAAIAINETKPESE